MLISPLWGSVTLVYTCQMSPHQAVCDLHRSLSSRTRYSKGSRLHKMSRDAMKGVERLSTYSWNINYNCRTRKKTYLWINIYVFTYSKRCLKVGRSSSCDILRTLGARICQQDTRCKIRCTHVNVDRFNIHIYIHIRIFCICMAAPSAKIWHALQVRFVFNYDVPREAEDYIHRAPLGRKRKRFTVRPFCRDRLW